MTMALIQCPECGKNVSDTTNECIHCGAPLKLRKKNRNIKKIVLATMTALLGVGVVLLVSANVFKKNSNHTIQNTELITLLEYSKSSAVKDMLGDNYIHKSYDALDTTSDDYYNIFVGDLYCEKVQLSYNKTGVYERVYIESIGLTKNEKNVLVKDLIAKYGKDYDYENQERESYQWTMNQERRVAITIWSREKGTYRVVINSFHHWL